MKKYRFVIMLVSLVLPYQGVNAEESTEYLEAIRLRAEKIVAPLDLSDSVAHQRVQDLVMSQYRWLNSVHNERDTELESIEGQSLDSTVKEERVRRVESAANQAVTKRHAEFVESLSNKLTAAQVEAIKDGMTYGIAPSTYSAYLKMLPDLSEVQKAYIMEQLIEAREIAMDGGSSKEKHQWFGKYKGRINNYLSRAGYDLKAASKRVEAYQAARKAVMLEEYVFDSAPFPSCHAATALELPDGELLCAFFGGTRERHPDVQIRLARKPIGGAWTEPVSIADGVQSESQRLPTWNPVLFQPSGGDLTLFYKVGPSPKEWWGMAKTSNDGGHIWSEARKLGEGLIGPVKNKPIQLKDGTIVAGSGTENNGWRVHIERREQGRDWKLLDPINPKAEIGAIQPTLLTYADGRIQMLCRTRSEHSVIAESWSKDDGLTWSPLKAMELSNNNSGFDGVTLADGRQLLVYNHSTRTQEGMGHKGRGILNVALSRDGIAWEAALVLDHLDESGKQFSYPAVIQSRDGLVHIFYTWHRKRIKHVVIDPAHLVTTPMPKGQWPNEGPASLATFKQLSNSNN